MRIKPYGNFSPASQPLIPLKSRLKFNRLLVNRFFSCVKTRREQRETLSPNPCFNTIKGDDLEIDRLCNMFSRENANSIDKTTITVSG